MKFPVHVILSQFDFFVCKSQVQIILCNLLLFFPVNFTPNFFQLISFISIFSGLLGGWYDACFSWTPTTERIQVFQFALPYTKPRISLFFTRKGNPNGFSPSDLTGKKIGE